MVKFEHAFASKKLSLDVAKIEATNFANAKSET